jgi:hypothetical protein
VANTANAVWNWVWQAVPAAPTPGSGAVAAAGSDARAGAEQAGPAASTPGVWSWSWTWKLPSGETWTSGWQQSCDCSWSWTWNWDWSQGAPGSTPAQAAPASGDEATPGAAQSAGMDIGSVDQENSSAATAAATVAADTTQTLDQSQTGTDAAVANQVLTADQTLLDGQQAIADAETSQAGALNLSLIRGISTGPFSQRNEVSAAAVAAATEAISQATLQQQVGSDSTDQSAAASQWLGSAQSVTAAASSAQTDAQNVILVSGPAATGGMVGTVEQLNSATATVTAAASADLGQWIGQLQIAGGSIAQGMDATQSLENVQSAAAAGVVSQTRTTNLAEIVVPAASAATNPSLRQRNLVSAVATASDVSNAVQQIAQLQEGAADAELASASQEGTASQQVLAFSPAEQTDLLNRSGWLGVEPAPVALGSAPGPGPGEPAPAAVASLVSGSSLLTSVAAGPGLPTVPPLGAPTLPVSRLGGLHAAAGRGGGVPAESSLWVARAALAPSAAAAAAHDAEGGAGGDSGSAGGTTGVALVLMSGAAGSAPHGGSGGAFGLADRAYRLVAPAHSGPHSQAPTLGRPVAFLDPIERPG